MRMWLPKLPSKGISSSLFVSLCYQIEPDYGTSKAQACFNCDNVIPRGTTYGTYKAQACFDLHNVVLRGNSTVTIIASTEQHRP